MHKLGTEKNPVIIRVKTQERAEELAAFCDDQGWMYIVGVEADKPEDISDIDRMLKSKKPVENKIRVGRNDPCPCGSGKKYKKCCLGKADKSIANEEPVDSIPRCGLCGKTDRLTKTPCCDQWVCDDAADYVPFSYERNSCFRNHTRYTICGYHYNEDHSGHWKECKECREDIETELYVNFATNEYNFEKLENPPRYDPKRCHKCGKRVKLGENAYSVKGGKYYCMNCIDII